MDFAAPAFGAVLAGLGQLDADVLFTIGRLDRAALGPVPANVHVESFLPQQVAMACDAVVCHGGAGTTMAALTRGLPMVVVPLFADQMHNAARIAARAPGWRSTRGRRRPSWRQRSSRSSPTRRTAPVPRGGRWSSPTLPTAADVLAAVRPAGVH